MTIKPTVNKAVAEKLKVNGNKITISKADVLDLLKEKGVDEETLNKVQKASIAVTHDLALAMGHRAVDVMHDDKEVQEVVSTFDVGHQSTKMVTKRMVTVDRSAPGATEKKMEDVYGQTRFTTRTIVGKSGEKDLASTISGYGATKLK